MAITIQTNNVPRFTLDACELARGEREQFDYLDWDAIDAGEDSATFVRYRGRLLDLGEFSPIGLGDAFAGWDGYISESFYSGVLMRFDSDFENVIMGRYYS